MNKLRLILVSLSILAIVILIFSIIHNEDSSRLQAPAKPQRIVSMAPNITEILFALGATEKVVAISNSCDYPSNAADNRTIISYWNPNVETIIAAKPDIVISMAFPQHKNVTDVLKRLRFNVLTLNLNKIEDLFTATQQIGDITDYSQNAVKLNERMKNEIERLKAKLSSASNIKVLWVIQEEPLRVAGQNTFVNELLELAGGENAIGATLQQYPPIAAEQLLGCGAEVIIQSAMGNTNIALQQKNAESFWKKYPNIPAVKNNRIYVVDSDIVLRLGPRLPKGAEMLARYLHPELFLK